MDLFFAKMNPRFNKLKPVTENFTFRSAIHSKLTSHLTMKVSFFKTLLGAVATLTSLAYTQTLQASWDYSYDETEAGKQVVFITPMNAGSDGSVAFVVTRGDGGGGDLQNQVFWLRAKEDGTSPDTPLWTSGWQDTSGFTDIVAVRRNHLVYYTGRELRSVTLQEDGTANAPVTVKVFNGPEEGGDPVVLTLEQARSPGFVFTVATQKDKRGFTLNAFQFTPAPAVVSAVPTYTTISSGNSLSISFRSALGVNYQLQSSTSLNAENWQPVSGAITGTGELVTLVQDAGLPRLFFRIIAL
jgi:hypothetical protein